MKPRNSESEGHQLELGAVLLESFINMEDELIILGNVINWEHFRKTFGESFHESQVECLSKGKAHKPYEFGNKVSFSLTAVGNWVIGAKSFFGNRFSLS